ncbi:MAG: glycosyltransferase, partial [Ignavibacteriaceae bacterium]|nr:glycosyltransferase [Ignavibacteriaceae bacterium]
IKAIAKLVDDELDIQLICTGNKTAYHEIIEGEIGKLNLDKNVKFLGIVPEEDLIGLYKAASLVVIPTLYEAGSGPLYEAMRYFSPVICSNVTSLPYTMGNDNFIFDPNNVKEIADLIKRMLTDDSLKKENINNSKKRMESLSAADYSKNFIDVYKKVGTI